MLACAGSGGPGSARVSRLGFGGAPTQSLPALGISQGCRRKEKFVTARTRSPARGTRALPILDGKKQGALDYFFI